MLLCYNQITKYRFKSFNNSVLYYSVRESQLFGMKLFATSKDSQDNNVTFMKSLWREVLAEFIGTFMLLVSLKQIICISIRFTSLSSFQLIGCSAGVAVQSNPENKPDFKTDIWAVNICWGFGAFVGIACSFNITGMNNLKRENKVTIYRILFIYSTNWQQKEVISILPLRVSQF